MTIEQWKLAKHLLRSDIHIVIEADKNLDGRIMDRETYIIQGIPEHLGNKEVYQKLTKEEANKNLSRQIQNKCVPVEIQGRSEPSREKFPPRGPVEISQQVSQ